jgi:mono/diheme cytochrome c family protein
MKSLAAAAIALLVVSSALAAGDAERGKALYQKLNCKMCHSADGSASTPAGKKFHARDLRSPEVQGESDSTLSGVIRNGKGKMPSWRQAVDDAGIADLVAYVRTLVTQK